MKIHITFLAVVIVFFISCRQQQEKEKETPAHPELSETTGSEEDQSMRQSWIDESEMDNLSNTWIDEADRGQLSTTWTEDAFAEELNTDPGLSNSWVDESGEKIHADSEIPPEFVGGKEALFNYFKDNIRYPDDVEDGTVYVAFVVGTNGEVRDARVFKGVKESMDKEALRLINNMPDWDPGLINGEPVASVYGLPIIFRP